jgi:hypothetical protein
MHTKDLARAGETSVRVSLVAAWRESTVFPTPSTPPGVSLIALINAPTGWPSSAASPAASIIPASSDNENSPVGKECHEFSA